MATGRLVGFLSVSSVLTASPPPPDVAAEATVNAAGFPFDVLGTCSLDVVVGREEAWEETWEADCDLWRMVTSDDI